ncbi:MAG: cytochrome P450 [Linnemannia gamsii]|nr:MAG: cytochrome P450 [Linnemannia gamsii]
MIGLLSANSASMPIDALKIALPIGIGLASAALLTIKMATNTADKSIPTVSIRAGDTTHDNEFTDDPDEFLARAVEDHGSVFIVKVLNQSLIAISGPMVREVFMNESFSFGDAMDHLTGVQSFMMSVIKSNKDPDSRVIHEIVRDNISPNLPLFTPRIVEQLERVIDEQLGYCEGKLVEKPIKIVQDMIAYAMANVFMGPDVAQHRVVIDTFIQVTYDFGVVIGRENRKDPWHAWTNRTKYGLLNPLHKHIQVLTDIAGPAIEERRRQEAEAIEKGLEYDRPQDIMQRLLDNNEKYGFVDLEDMCGHLLILILVSVHTTTDTSNNLMYYLAAFPEYVEPLFQEQQEVLAQISNERAELRQKNIESGEFTSLDEFTGTELDPAHDRDLSAAAVKRMVHMDSFVREIFRNRTPRLDMMHLARKPVTLSNGMRIAKGQMVVVNIHSLHQTHDFQGEDPTEFRPWRFLGKAKAATKAATDFLPFGMGRHACPGRFLAIQELKTVGALVVSRYSKIEMQDPSHKKRAILSRIGDPCPSGLIFTSRSVASNDKEA